MANEAPWSETLDTPRSEIRPVAEGRKRLRAGQLMLYPNGRAVDGAIRAIPEGKTRTLKELRASLAQSHGADVTCPVTTGIALRAVAEAVGDAVNAGTPLEEITPVWRVLDARSATLKRLSFDPGFILEQRAHEAREQPGAPHDV